MLISMHISNCFVILCNIQIVIQMLKIKITVLQVWIWGLFKVKIGSCLQIACFFLFYWNLFQLPPPPRPPGFSILPNVLTPCLLGPKYLFQCSPHPLSVHQTTLPNKTIELTYNTTLFLIESFPCWRFLSFIPW